MKALAHWRPYLGWMKTPFFILTDHANLQYWKAPQNLNYRTAQWHANLQEYNYKIKYIPGKENSAADALSRPPGVDTGEEDNKNITVIDPSRFETICLTQTSCKQMMIRVHDHPTAAHPGRDETLCQLRVQGIVWPGMKQWVADYIKGCAVCQQSKILTHRIKTALYRIPTPPDAKPFQQIAMDLIIRLWTIRCRLISDEFD
jgi:Integrase zinc binding domain/RNase H-like domain found in reverse transcriptase